MRLRLVGSVCGATASLLLLAGCGKRETAVAKADLTQTLLLGNMIEPPDLDPQLCYDNFTQQIELALCQGLCEYDPKTNEPTPALAERWEPSGDYLTWTFHLRPNARWSDGDPVTAEDFVYSYHRMCSPNLAAEYAYMMFFLKNGHAFYTGQIRDFDKVGVHAADEHTLVLTLERPISYLPALVCHTSWFPVHRSTIEKFGKMDDRGTHWTRPGNFVGCGPFNLVEWIPHQIIRVVKSPTFWNRDHIRLHEVDFYPIEDNSTEEAMFRRGQLHITATLPPDKIPVYRNDPALRPLLTMDPYLGTYFYFFNVKKPPLNDARVRKALAYAINRKEIVDRVALGGELPAGHLCPPDLAGFTATAEVPSDPVSARRLLAEAGFPGGRGFPHLEILYNTNEGHRKIAEAIQAMWKRELGIDVSLRNEEAKVQDDSMRQGSYTIGRYAWVGDYIDPSTFMDLMLGDNGNNYSGWKNPEYDRLVDAADHDLDQSRRFARYQRAEQILVDQCPIMPIYFYTRCNLRRPDVKGWYSNLLDEHPFTDVYLEAPAK
ncbi:MAG TPA: peptide ABC transporter substrate-binding protein [Opitutaceae bacterium]|nr:peptide ABC transporter substrate-binding protein [Opitutaceae bacterium]